MAEIMTRRKLERIMLRLINSGNPDFSQPKEPSDDEIREACNNARMAYGKKVLLRLPDYQISGVLKEGYLGCSFIYYNSGKVYERFYSPEDIKLEQKEPSYIFSTNHESGVSFLRGLEGILGKVILFKAGIRGPNSVATLRKDY